MNFAGALFAIQRGHKVKRKHWTGYWMVGPYKVVTPDGKAGELLSIKMHTYDGKVVDIRNTTDIFYTLSSMACDDWEIVEDWDKKTTQPDYMGEV